MSLRRWLVGCTVTAARSVVPGMAAARLVGHRIESVEARGKHLLIRFDEGPMLHTHMRMTGSWHVYSVGDPWKRPERQARLVLEAGDRVAVCFNAPVVELVAVESERAHPSLGSLGPDVLADPLDLVEIGRRARDGAPSRALGELLLDQQVVSGIGNIYRCETLFLRGLNPWTVLSALTDAELSQLVECASELMRQNLGPGFAGHHQRWVYRRAGRPCRRCGTAISARGQGEQARRAYWCPRCQPAPTGPTGPTGPSGPVPGADADPPVAGR